ncbi:MAG: DUF1549 domain-containing protein, partial [Planctomycetota bacterium]|nr:DUF1549 domain-containing protein [Planctomycetota bacterium]
MRGLPLLLMIATATTGLRAEAAEPNDAARNLLSKHCFSCHGPDKQQGGLRLDQRRSLLAGGDSGEPAIRPGKPVASELIRRITSRDAEVMMPPKGPRLSSRAVGMISEWIRRGAVMPRDANTRTSHWSFQPLKPVRLPTLSRAGAARARSPIDSFIIAQLAASQLQLSAPTDRRRLLRRASLVLTGLPPSPKQAQHFQADLEPGAWERAVDRLLASPRYGERWASHWLDLVRFAETTGYETNS